MEQLCVDLLTGLHEAQILLWAKSGPDRFPLPMQEIDRNVIPRLEAHGLHLADTKENAELIQSILLESGKNARIQFQHRELGFKELDGKLVFLAQHPIGCSDALKAQSEYAGEIAMGTAGTLDDYKQVLLDEVVGHPPLELALAISLVPLIVYFLRRDGYINDLPIFAFVGPSSTGKTTALRLIASVYGPPIESDGLIGDFNSTELAIPARLAGLAGMPLILDEATDSDISLQKQALRFSKGRDRNRCKTDGTLRKAVKFVGAFVLTSEKSVLEDQFNATGASARVVELSLPSWTENATHAMRLERKLMQQHGTAVTPFVETVLRSRNALPKFYTREFRLLSEEEFADNAVEGRKLKMYALVLVAATFVKLALGIALDKERLRKLLVEQHRLHQPEPESRDRTARLYDAVQNFLAKNHARMIGNTNCAKFPNPDSILGKFTSKNHRKCAWISRTELDTFFRENGCLNVTEALQLLSERGWVYRSADRHYAFRQQLGKTRPYCYCFFL